MIKTVTLHETNRVGTTAAKYGATLIRHALADRGEAAIVIGAGPTQFEMLRALARESGIDWQQVTVFGIAAMLGLAPTHPAGASRELHEHFINRLPTPLKALHLIDAVAPDADAEAERMSRLIDVATIDVAFLGIGDNGRIGFNEPPADFEANEAYQVVPLDEGFRHRQQINHGRFAAALGYVPERAITMTLSKTLAARHLVFTVIGESKAQAVDDTLHGPITPDVPASLLRTHPRGTMFLDDAAASLLRSMQQAS